jgi:hypothetical protein
VQFEAIPQRNIEASLLSVAVRGAGWTGVSVQFFGRQVFEMRVFPSPLFVRPRGLICAVTIAFATGTALGWTAALPGASASVNGEASPMKPDFDLVFASLSAAPRIEDSAKIVARKDFDLVFASIATPQRINTPSQREKLRNAGWRRLLQSADQKPAASRLSAGESPLSVN